MSFKSLLSLPTEITENILSYLTNYEVNTLGIIGNEHLKRITDAFVKRRGIYFTNFINKLHSKHSIILLQPNEKCLVDYFSREISFRYQNIDFDTRKY